MVALVVLALWGLGGASASWAEPARKVENLYGAKMLDATTGFAVGAFGVVFKTTDAGVTWVAQKSPTLEYLFSVDFVSPTEGVACGKAGMILHTTDGGATWEIRTSGTDRNLFSIAYSSPSRVWAVGDWGTVVTSQDGGRTWTNRSLEDDIILNAQSWPDDRHGYFAGEFGTVRYTTDGGETFQKADTGTEKSLFGVGFASANDGWAVGIDGLVLRTRDGARTWEVQRGKREVESLEQLGFMEALRNPGLYDVRVTKSSGYVVGDTGMILVSTDGGETWQERKLPAEMSLYWLRGVSTGPGGMALIVGANGLTAIARGDEIHTDLEQGRWGGRR